MTFVKVAECCFSKVDVSLVDLDVDQQLYYLVAEKKDANNEF
jgi:hypothetical protein